MAADASSLSGAASEWSFPTASLLQTVPRNVRSGWASCRALQSLGISSLGAPKPTGRARLAVQELLGEV